jgi:hypothetical protein
MQHANPLNPELAVKMLLLLGIVFAVILMAGAMLAIGFVLYGILTMPFMVLVELTVRFFLISLVLYVVGRVVWPLVRSFRRQEI